jgi:putative copper export protein
MVILDVLMRYLHIVSAVLAVGGAFFLLVLLPKGLALIDDPARRDEVLLRVRRGFKMVVHPSILGLIVSGIYNTVANWPTYALNKRLNHGFWGPHLLLGLAVMGVSLWLLAGRGLRENHRKWLKVNVALMLVTILLASTLRWARLSTVAAKWDEDKKQLEELKAARAAGAPTTPATLPTTQPVTVLP